MSNIAAEVGLYDDREIVESRKVTGMPGKDGDRHLLSLMYTLRHARKECKSENEVQQVSDAQSGSVVCFEKLCERYSKRLWFLCYQILGNREDAMDITTETMIKSWTELHTLREPSRFGPWLFGIAQRQCINFRQKQAHRNELTNGEFISLDVHETDHSSTLMEMLPDEHFTKEYAEALLRADKNAWVQCWAKLPQGSRLILLYIYRWGGTLREVGWSQGSAKIKSGDDAQTEQAKLDSAYNNGKYHVRKALKQLENILQQNGFSLTASEALQYLHQEEETKK